MDMPQFLTWFHPHVFAAPVYLSFIALEIAGVRYWGWHGRYETRDALTSIAMGLGNAITGFLIPAIGVSLVFLAYEYRVATIGWSWWAVLVAFILDDLRFYWSHRISHRSRWFWAVHVVHHSSEHYNFSTALRQPWTGQISGMVLIWMPLALLGFHPLMLFFVSSINLVYQFFLHTEAVTRFHPWIEAVFNTPSHHRVHHGRNPRYLDANYAGVLIIWDRMFGTFVPELDREKVQYGLVKNIETFNPLHVAFDEYGGIARDLTQPHLSLWQRVLYLFAPPGYSHDGSRPDSLRIKADYVRAHPQEAGTPGLPAMGDAAAYSLARST